MEGERPPPSLISDQSQEGNQKAKEVEMRRLTEENERLRCQTESLKEEMRNMEEEYESRQTKLRVKLEDAVQDLMVEKIINNETRVKNEKLNEEAASFGAYCEQPPKSPPRRMVEEEARWSPKRPVTEICSFDLGIPPWVSWQSPLVTGIITIPEKNFNTPSSLQIIDLTMMEREPAKYQMIVSPQV
ncbi:hypothetical protein ACLB2K_007266 [Fragaria x ananassa]